MFRIYALQCRAVWSNLNNISAGTSAFEDFGMLDHFESICFFDFPVPWQDHISQLREELTNLRGSVPPVLEHTSSGPVGILKKNKDSEGGKGKVEGGGAELQVRDHQKSLDTRKHLLEINLRSLVTNNLVWFYFTSHQLA